MLRRRSAFSISWIANERDSYTCAIPPFSFGVSPLAGRDETSTRVHPNTVTYRIRERLLLQPSALTQYLQKGERIFSTETRITSTPRCLPTKSTTLRSSLPHRGTSAVIPGKPGRFCQHHAPEDPLLDFTDGLFPHTSVRSGERHK